jgi:hypothetical protein
MLRIFAISLLISALAGSSFAGESDIAGILGLQKTPKTFTTNQATPNADIETQIFDINIPNYPMDSIAFSFSKLTNELLVILISYNKNPHSLIEDQWRMTRRLLKKYGTPSRVRRDTLQWSTPNLVINAEVSKRVVSYYYLQHISEHSKLENQTVTSLIQKTSLCVIPAG